MPVLAFIFGYLVLQIGSTIFAMHGRYAVRLDLPGSAVIPYVPWLGLAAYLVVFVILRLKLRWRWLALVAAFFAGLLVVGHPVTVLNRGSIRIPIAASLNRESQQAFAARYPHVKWVAYSSSGDGRCIRIRRDDYSPELAAFVTGLAAQQPE